MNNNNALLIIDMQQEDGFVLENFDTVATNTATLLDTCLLYTSPSPRDGLLSRMPSSA